MLDTLLSLTLAVFPGLILALAMYIRDHYEPEPIRLLVLAFGLGFLALLISLIPGELLASSIEGWGNFLESKAIHAFAVVAFTEESCKFLMVRWFLYPNPNFNEPLDGIVYSVMVGLGFATLENVFYVLRDGSGEGLIRMFSAIPAHALFAVVMGYYLGIAKFSPLKGNSYAAIGLLLSILLHGAYDYFLFISSIPGMWIGAAVSLIFAGWMAMRSIKLHHQASPFREKGDLQP
jgi:RsiW-degrading membrane proteinase PrsW (M82 family)